MATQEIRSLWLNHRADMGEWPKDEARKRERSHSVASTYSGRTRCRQSKRVPSSPYPCQHLLFLVLFDNSLVQLLWNAVWRFLKELKIDLPNGRAILLLGIYLKKMKTLTQKDTYTLYSLQHYLQQPRCGNNLGVYQWMSR